MSAFACFIELKVQKIRFRFTELAKWVCIENPKTESYKG